MVSSKVPQCIILGGTPMRSLCGMADMRFTGITLPTVHWLNAINAENPDRPRAVSPVRRMPLGGAASAGRRGRRGRGIVKRTLL